MREKHRIVIQHPLEIHAFVDLAGELGDFGVLGKILRRRQNAAQ